MINGNNEWLRTSFRRMAYDFHIPDSREDFLSMLDPELTAETLAKAGVQAVQLYAKSCWGLSLHPTAVGKQHPNIRGRDYFGEVLDALNRRGVRCLAYLCDYWDNYAASQHPEWRFRTLRQSRGEEPLQEEWWMTLCPQTGYHEYFIRQLTEVAERYPVAGMFVDMTGFLGYCYCDSCRSKFKKDTGLAIPEAEDWNDPAWRTFIAWRYTETERLIGERRDAVKRVKPELVFGHNYHGNPYHYYSLSHDPVNAHRHSDYLTTETAPWDDGFGLLGGSQAAKFARDAACGKPFEAAGARCATGHDFTEKSIREMMLEAYSVVAHNCPYLIIESASEKGLPIPRGFELIGKVFERIQGLEPWIADSRAVPHVGILWSRASADFYNSQDKHRAISEMNGFYKACVESHLPVSFLFDQMLDEEHLSQYAVVVLPDAAVLSEWQCAALKAYVRDGGGVVATHQTSLYTPDGGEREQFLLAEMFGVERLGPAADCVTWMTAAEEGASKILFRESPAYVPVAAARAQRSSIRGTTLRSTNRRAFIIRRTSSLLPRIPESRSLWSTSTAEAPASMCRPGPEQPI